MRTVNRVTSKSTSTTVSAITRLCGMRPAARARCQAGSTSSTRNTTDWPSPGAAAIGLTTSGKPACSATVVSSSTDPANQNGAVGSPSSSAASLRRPSRSRDSRVLRGVGNTSMLPRSATAISASAAMTPASATT